MLQAAEADGLKIIGAVIVIGACLSIGQRRVIAVRRELCTLGALMHGVRIMRAELTSRLCPMEELLRKAAEHAGREAEDVFLCCAESLSKLNENSFSELWSDSCGTILSIPAEERRQLELLGESLGRYELDEQLAACDRYLHDAGVKVQKLRMMLPELRKLSLALSAAAGAFLCLLIL